MCYFCLGIGEHLIESNFIWNLWEQTFIQSLEGKETSFLPDLEGNQIEAFWRTWSNTSPSKRGCRARWLGWTLLPALVWPRWPWRASPGPWVCVLFWSYVLTVKHFTALSVALSNIMYWLTEYFCYLLLPVHVLLVLRPLGITEHSLTRAIQSRDPSLCHKTSPVGRGWSLDGTTGSLLDI